MDFKYKSQKEVNELTDEQVEVYAKEVKAHESALQTKAIELAVKESEKGFDAKLKAITDEKEEMQKHLDALDVKLQKKDVMKTAVKEGFVSKIKTELKENFEAISTVRKGNSTKIDVKAVGDMTLANLTGDQPRDYSNTVITTPSPLINFVDLIGGVINISGGTYTFPQETGTEGAISTQTEGALKSQIDYDFTMKDVNTDFLAGTTTYSKKMSNNLPFLQSFIPSALRRDYFKSENVLFNTELQSVALASTEVITGKNKIEMLMNEVARLEQLDNPVNAIVVRPSDWWDIQKTEKSTGAGYGLPGVITYTNGTLYINGIPVYKATWMTADKYYVGDFTRLKKVVTEGLSLEFSEEDKDNFSKNNITARIESQIALAYERNTAIIYGDFTAV